MGTLGKEMAQPSPSFIEQLLRAYADEWFGHYNYSFVSKMVSGSSSASVAGLLAEKSEEALSRADRLAMRIIELGGQPVPKLTQLMEHASDKPFKLPDNLSDVEGLLRAVLDAERTSIRTHWDLHAQCRERDPITAALILTLLTEAVRGEQLLERLLADSAPEMDGT